MKYRILVVEDDTALRKILRDNLEHEGFDVVTAGNGQTALTRAKEFAPDLALLDVMLPDLDGFELCRLLRGARNVSVIFLTVRGHKDDKVKGLRLGADDYVSKPFDLEELLARIHAVLRRTSIQVRRLVLDHIIIDFDTLRAWNDGGRIDLSHRDFELLRYLAERRGAVVSRAELLRVVWGYSDLPDTRPVDHAILRLRRKLEPDLHHPKFIRTVHGDGYCLMAASKDTEPSGSV